MKLFGSIVLSLFVSWSYGQIWLDGIEQDEPNFNVETLYFPYDDGIQLIVVNYYDAWSRKVDFYEMTQPRGASWASIFGRSLPNAYIFRDSTGKILEVYNTFSDSIGGTDAFSARIQISDFLEAPDFVNTDSLSFLSIQDYNQFKGHLMYYSDPQNISTVGFLSQETVDTKVGIINLKGEIVVEAIYDEIRVFQDREEEYSKYIISNDGKFGFLDSNFKVLFHPIYKTYHSSNKRTYNVPEHNTPHGRHLKVFKDDRCGLIDQTGNVLIDFMYDDIYVGHDSCYLAVIKKPGNGNYRYFWYAVESCAVYDREFNLLSVVNGYDQIEYHGINAFRVKKGNMYGIVNMHNQVVVPPEYTDVHAKRGGYWVTINSKTGLTSTTGETLLPTVYDRFFTKKNAFFVVLDGLIGVYTMDCKEIAKAQFDSGKWERDKNRFVLNGSDGDVGIVQFSEDKTYYRSPTGIKTYF